MAKTTRTKRKKKYCPIYKMLGMRLKNKRKKLERHMKRLPGDLQAIKAFKRLFT